LKIFNIVTCISNVLLFQSEEGWEEIFDYIFPEDEATKPNLRVLEMAKTWKKQKEKAEEEGEEEKATSELQRQC
jgi:crooked neck